MPNTKETWMQAAASSAQGALGIGIQRLGAKYDRKQQLKTQEAMMGMQMKGEREMMAEQQRLALEMWEKTGPKGQMEQMRKAGLNPALMYGGGGAGGATTGPGGSPSVTGGQAGYVDTTGMGLQHGMAMAQQRLMNAQANNLDADTQNKTKQGPQIEAQTGNILQDTKNKQAQEAGQQITNRLLKLDEELKKGTLEENILKVVAELDSAQAIAKSLETKQFIDQATAETTVKQIQENLATSLLQAEVMRSGMAVDKAQIAKAAAEIVAMAEATKQHGRAVSAQEKQADTARLEQEHKAKIDNVSESTKLTREVIMNIISGIRGGGVHHRASQH